MKAMMLYGIHQPLKLVEFSLPDPDKYQVLVKIMACGVCRTDIHLIDGELAMSSLPIIPGHEIVGRVVDKGSQADIEIGEIVGIPWLAGTCQSCYFCCNNMENLCDQARFTGCQVNGGYSEYCLADSRYILTLDDNINAAETAPLLCAGLIGFRSYKMATSIKGTLSRVGIFGFGAAAHIIAQIILQDGLEFYAFTRHNDVQTQSYARKLGAAWAGSALEPPPHALDAAIIFAPVGALVPRALSAIRKGGSVVCAGIHMSDIPSFPYKLLWGERNIRSVANLTRQDGIDFFNYIQSMSIKTNITRFPLIHANRAIKCLREGAFDGAAVLIP